MNVPDVLTMVERVRASAKHPEIAHLHEDRLCWAVLRAIADGAGEDPAALAAAALTAGAIPFQRWYAAPGPTSP